MFAVHAENNERATKRLVRPGEKGYCVAIDTLIATLPQDYGRAETYSELLVKRSLELGGTATGEHGIGLVKRKFMEAEHGAALGWMRQIKALFDPQGILNPGKIV